MQPHPLLLAFCVLYIICPIDLIPDSIFAVGWFDDLGLLSYVISEHSGRKDKPA